MNRLRKFLFDSWGIFGIVLVSLFLFPKAILHYVGFGYLELIMAVLLIATAAYKVTGAFKAGMKRA